MNDQPTPPDARHDRWINLENRRHRLTRPLLCVVGILALTFVITFYMNRFVAPPYVFVSGCIAVLGSFAVCLIMLVAWGIIRWPTRHQTARRLDDALVSHNRFEAAEELRDHEHPLRKAQLGETASYFSVRKPRTLWPLVRDACVTMICMLVIGLFIHLIGMYRVTAHDASIAQSVPAGHTPMPGVEMGTDSQTDPDDAAPLEPGPEPPPATLLLVEPRPLYKATAVDEVIWQGSGVSPAGFESIEFEFNINGDDPQTRPVADAPLSQVGEVVLEDALLLDELELEPFDVVGYRLLGDAPIDADQTSHAASPMHFIQIRPLDEETFQALMSGAGAGAEAVAGEGEQSPRQQLFELTVSLMEILHRQIALTSATYQMIADQLTMDMPGTQKRVSAAVVEQNELIDATEAFLGESAGDQGPSTPVAEAVTEAQSAMRDAVVELRGDDEGAEHDPRLPEAGVHQQRAVAHLVKAFQQQFDELSAAATAAPASGESQPELKWPFNDDQQYIKPELDQDESAESRLEQALKDQAAVLDQLEGREPTENQGTRGPQMVGDKGQQTQGSDPDSQDPASGSDSQGDGKEPGSGQGESPGQGSQPGQGSGSGQGQGSGSGSGSGGDSGPGSGPSADSEPLVQQQARVTEALNEIAENKSLPPSVYQDITEARQSSQQAQEALAANTNDTACIAAHKTMTDMQRALQDMRDQADREARLALRVTELELMEAKELAEGNEGDEAAQKTQQAMARLTDQAEYQNESGRRESAEKFSDLAQQMAEDDIPADLASEFPVSYKRGLDHLDEAVGLLAAARTETQTPTEQLADALGRMQDLHRQVKHATNLSEPQEAKQTQSMLNQVQQAARDTVRSTQQLGGPAKSMATTATQISEAVDASSDASRGIVISLEPKLAELIVEGRRVLAQLEDAAFVRSFNEDEVPKEYREDVAEYFKQLSQGAHVDRP